MITQDEWYDILGDVPSEPIDLALFKGGFGEKWGDILTALMEKEHPGIKLNFTWDPAIADKIQPRLIAGDVPDFLFSGFTRPSAAVKDKLVLPGDFLLDARRIRFVVGQEPWRLVHARVARVSQLEFRRPQLGIPADVVHLRHLLQRHAFR